MPSDEKLWTQDLGTLWRDMEWDTIMPSGLPVDTVPRVNALTRFALLLMGLYTFLCYGRGERMNGYVYMTAALIVAAAVMNLSDDESLSSNMVRAAHLIKDEVYGTPDIPYHTRRTQTNPYQNPLVWHRPGDMMPATPPMFDDGLQRMALYGTSMANPRHTFHQVPDPSQLSRAPVARANYGSHVSEAERGLGRGGMWM